jgi:hypothetical protein
MKVPIQEPRRPPADLRVVAVACELNPWRRTHVGFLYEREDGTHWHCHLAWELILRNVPATIDDRCWVNINIPPQILELLAAALELMDQNAAIIPYDIRYSSSAEYFDATTWAYHSHEPGLTCSTFILALLRGFRLELFEVSSWPGRPSDNADLEFLIRQLELRGVNSGRVAAMRANHQGIRFRPEEVCGSVSESFWPVPFATAETAGEEVLQHVVSR